MHFAEPWLTRVQATGAADVWLSQTVAMTEAQSSVLAFGPSLLIDNPEAGMRFMVAYLKGVRQYQAGKTERNLEILGTYLELDQELLTAACFPRIPADGVIFTQSIEDFAAWAAARDYIDRPLTGDVFWEPLCATCCGGSGSTVAGSIYDGLTADCQAGNTRTPQQDHGVCRTFTNRDHGKVAGDLFRGAGRSSWAACRRSYCVGNTHVCGAERRGQSIGGLARSTHNARPNTGGDRARRRRGNHCRPPLASLKAGCSYVLLEPDPPVARLAALLSMAHATLVPHQGNR